MRLICPKCGAEYEPPQNMMPSSGRHVQCSDCHTRWFARAESEPMLTEDEIIARLESRAPNLRVVDEPVAAAWDGAREDEETEAPVEAGERGSAEARDESEGGFTWEAPETGDPTEPFRFEEPEAPRDEGALTLDGAKEDGASGAPPEAKGAAPDTPDEKVSEASQTDVRSASQDSPLRGAQKARAAEVVHPRIVVHSAPRNRFWHGFAASLALFALLFVLYLVAIGLSGNESALGAAARSYGGLVGSLREAVSGILSAT